LPKMRVAENAIAACCCGAGTASVWATVEARWCAEVTLWLKQPGRCNPGDKVRATPYDSGCQGRVGDGAVSNGRGNGRGNPRPL
jgi:hypothetical protein